MTSIIPILIEGDVKICTDFDLNDMTCYSLLEHEDWFEYEIGFIRRFIVPGMNAYDVGANHGVYAFALAAKIGEGGHVWAFEPTRKPLACLEASLSANAYRDRVTVVPVALSDREGVALMGISEYSEGSSLNYESGGTTEEVTLRTLDAVWHEQGRPKIDFVKLDAEGEEVNILKGGSEFLNNLSPVVMFEAKNGENFNFQILSAFRAIGYGLFRLLPGLDALIPCDEGSAFDPYQLNIFACKPDRAAELEARGLLFRPPPSAIGAITDPLPNPADCPFAALFAPDWHGDDRAAALILAARQTDRPLAERWCCLRQSLAILEGDHHLAAGLMRIRVFRAIGQFADAVRQLRRIIDIPAEQWAAQLSERPFVPSLPGWDDRPVAGGKAVWCAALSADTLRACDHYSSFFAQTMWGPLWEQRNNPNLSLIMRRTLILPILRAGHAERVPPGHEILLEDGPGHHNAGIWRQMLTPSANPG